MTELEQMRELAESALSGQRVVRHECLVGNAAAEELKAIGPMVLPVIEQVITSRVVPASLEAADQHELMQRFPGLLSLWVAYLRISRQVQLQEAASFVRSLRGPVLASGVLGCMSVWGHSGRGGLPPPIATLLQEVAERPSDSAAEVARQRLFYLESRTTG